MSMDSGDRGNGLQRDARDYPGEHPQGIGGQAFKTAHPYAYWIAVEPTAIMVGIVVVAMLAVIVIRISMV